MAVPPDPRSTRGWGLPRTFGTLSSDSRDEMGGRNKLGLFSVQGSDSTGLPRSVCPDVPTRPPSLPPSGRVSRGKSRREERRPV